MIRAKDVKMKKAEIEDAAEEDMRMKDSKTKKAESREIKKNSRKGLRVMKKNRSHNVVRNGARITKYGVKGFSRNIWLSMAATVVMTITLVILFVTVVASAILTNTADIMRDKIDITIYFKPDTSEETLSELTEKIKQDENVKSVVTATAKEEYEKFIAENEGSDDILEIMDDEMTEMMIAKMQATMRIKVYNIDDLEVTKKIVETDELFVATLDEKMEPTFDTNQVEINTITTWAKIARMGGMILAVVFLIISVLIIFSTIRMAIFSRREEIYMMKLVGADKGFIRGPFLVEAEICGVIAGLIAGAISYFGYEFLAPKLMSYGIDVSQISRVLESNQLILVFAVFVGLGVLIGWLSARLAVSKYLRKNIAG